MGEKFTNKVIYIASVYLFFTFNAFAQNYSFEREAHKAKWIVSVFDANGVETPNVTQTLVFNRLTGNWGQEVGYSARKTLEDNTDSERVIVARPYNIKNSVLKGVFPKITSLAENAIIYGSFGFAQHKDNDRPHQFSVYIHHYIGGIEKRELLIKESKSFNNRMQDFEVDISKYAGKVVFFELEVVNTGGNQNGNTPIWNNIEVKGDPKVRNNLIDNAFLIKPQSGNGYLEVDQPWNNFAPLQIDQLTRDNSQRFTFKDAGQGFYYIALENGKVLTLDLSNPSQGNVYFTDLFGMDYQKWKVVSSSGTYIHYIQSLLGNFLEVKEPNVQKSSVGVGLRRSGYQNWVLSSINQ